MIPTLKELCQKVWHWSSGEETNKTNDSGNQVTRVSSDQVNSYLRDGMGQGQGKPVWKSLVGRKAASFETGVKQLELIGAIRDSGSPEELNKLEQEVSSGKFDSSNQEILNGIIQEQQQKLRNGASQG